MQVCFLLYLCAGLFSAVSLCRSVFCRIFVQAVSPILCTGLCQLYLYVGWRVSALNQHCESGENQAEDLSIED